VGRNVLISGTQLELTHNGHFATTYMYLLLAMIPIYKEVRVIFVAFLRLYILFVQMLDYHVIQISPYFIFPLSFVGTHFEGFSNVLPKESPLRNIKMVFFFFFAGTN
jgi:hypothetical protein